MKLVCFIPTKSRFTTKTYQLFENANIDTYHFIEPQEFNKYNVPNKIDIKKNNTGVTYVRNFMLDYAKKINLEWVIFCDDDVTQFGVFDGKTKKLDANIWHIILGKAKKLPFELVGINYQQHAWHEKKSYSINKKFVEVCVLMNVKNINWKYTDNTKEDRDFQLQTIKNGNGALKFNHYFFACPNVGSNSGGLQKEYQSKKDKDWAINLTKKWHPFTKLVSKKGRVDCKVDIKEFAKHNKKIVK
tara:strand:+ start:547 stop:1278 length:732 start_codon:yes stop_codon:yes gene_type:complete